MSKSEQDYDKLIAECTEELTSCPDNVDALCHRGLAWNKKKQFDNAIADFDKALTWDPDRVDVLNNRGLAYSGKGEHDLAIADFTEAITRSSSHSDLHHFYFNRGRTLRLKEKFKESIDDFNIALQLDSQYVKAYRLRGLSRADIGDDRLAIADFDCVIRVGSGTADDFHNRGNAWLSLGRFRKAIADFTRAINLDPKATDVAKTYASRGIAWKRRGRYAKALNDFERARELDPHSPQRHATLARLLATCPNSRYRDGARALRLITQAYELSGEWYADYLDCVASAYAAQGDFPSAVDYQRRALELTTTQEEKNWMRLYIESYQAHAPCFDEPPSWRDWWA